MFAPENGNMLGGTMVNLTGPCFVPGTRVTCRYPVSTLYSCCYTELGLYVLSILTTPTPGNGAIYSEQR